MGEERRGGKKVAPMSKRGSGSFVMRERNGKERNKNEKKHEQEEEEEDARTPSSSFSHPIPFLSEREREEEYIPQHIRTSLCLSCRHEQSTAVGPVLMYPHRQSFSVRPSHQHSIGSADRRHRRRRRRSTQFQFQPQKSFFASCSVYEKEAE